MTGARVATAAVLIPIVAGLVLWGPAAAVALAVGAVAVLCLAEFFALGERVGLRGYRLWTFACAAGIVWQQWTAAQARAWNLAGELRLIEGGAGGAASLELVLLVFVAGAAAIVFASRRPLADALGGLSVSAAGLVLVALPLSAMVRLRGVAEIGPQLLLFVLVLVWAGDTCAYFAGRRYGRLPMAPQLSPKKTWEGAVAGLLGSLVAGAAFAGWLGVGAGHALAMAAVGNVAGQAGDLLESVYKRSAGVKDSGKLLPGHGGILDRVDALILAAPAVWYYFDLVVARRF